MITQKELEELKMEASNYARTAALMQACLEPLGELARLMQTKTLSRREMRQYRDYRSTIDTCEVSLLDGVQPSGAWVDRARIHLHIN